MKLDDILGVNFGEFIVSQSDVKPTSPPLIHSSVYEEAVNSIRALQTKFGNRIYIVSRVQPSEERSVIDWLEQNLFLSQIKITKRNVWFCREHIHKASICNLLGITHFVDNTLEVLCDMPNVPNRFFLNSNNAADDKHATTGIREVKSWEEIVSLIL